MSTFFSRRTFLKGGHDTSENEPDQFRPVWVLGKEKSGILLRHFTEKFA